MSWASCFLHKYFQLCAMFDVRFQCEFASRMFHLHVTRQEKAPAMQHAKFLQCTILLSEWLRFQGVFFSTLLLSLFDYMKPISKLNSCLQIHTALHIILLPFSWRLWSTCCSCQRKLQFSLLNERENDGLVLALSKHISASLQCARPNSANVYVHMMHVDVNALLDMGSRIFVKLYVIRDMQ